MVGHWCVQWSDTGVSDGRTRGWPLFFPFATVCGRNIKVESKGGLPNHSYWKQLFEDNLPHARGRGALRLLRSSRFALTQPDRFATGASTRPRPLAILELP